MNEAVKYRLLGRHGDMASSGGIWRSLVKDVGRGGMSRWLRHGGDVAA